MRWVVIWKMGGHLDALRICDSPFAMGPQSSRSVTIGQTHVRDAIYMVIYSFLLCVFLLSRSVTVAINCVSDACRLTSDICVSAQFVCSENTHTLYNSQ